MQKEKRRRHYPLIIKMIKKKIIIEQFKVNRLYPGLRELLVPEAISIP
jgi:hypothetical protein